MGLSVGIVGLPNVGKSTLFNALLKKQQAYVANFPFATIEPNVGVVPVPDERLKKLSEAVKETEGLSFLPPEVPATVEFLDIAGLIAGASKGEGLGNKFLAHIRETDAVCHVVRAFSDPEIIKQGVTDPKTDFETVETELKLADFQTLEKQKDPGNTPDKDLIKWWEAVTKLKDALQRGIPAREIQLNEEEQKEAKGLSLLTAKPILIVLNVDEGDLKNADELEKEYSIKFGLENQDRPHAPGARLPMTGTVGQAQATGGQVVAICAKTEAELAGLTDTEQKEYLKSLGVEKTGLERLIQKAFATLGLITFLTAGEKEVRAWTIKKGTNAQDASGVIHTDFMKNFIKADVVDFEDFIKYGWKKARDEGKVRSEGKEYIMKDGEVVEFKIGS